MNYKARMLNMFPKLVCWQSKEDSKYKVFQTDKPFSILGIGDTADEAWKDAYTKTFIDKVNTEII